MLGFIFKNELLVLTFIHNFTMDFFIQGKMGIRFRIPLPPGPIDDSNDDGANLQNHGFNWRFLRARPLDLCFVGDSLTSMTQTMTEFESRQSVSYYNSLYRIYILDDETILCLRNFLLGFFNKQKALPEKLRAVAIVLACTILIVIQGFGILCLYVRKCRLKVYLKCLQTNSLTSRWLKFLLELGHLIPWLPPTS